MSAVNGVNNDTEDIGNLMMRSLPQRTVSIPTNIQNSRNINVNRPIDPVQSVSSASYSSPDIAFDVHQYETPKNNTSRIVPARNNSSAPSKSIQTSKQSNVQPTNVTSKLSKNNIEPEVFDGGDDGNDNNNIDSAENPVQTPAVASHLTSIMGYSIPTCTLYFIAVLVIIAIGLYFLTGEKKKPEKTDSPRHDQQGHDPRRDPRHDPRRDPRYDPRHDPREQDPEHNNRRNED